MSKPEPRKSPRGDQLVRATRALTLLSVLFSLVASCSPGELHLTTEDRESDEESDGATGGSGGQEPQDDTGGRRSEDDGFDPELPDIDFLSGPCVARGDCDFFICEPDEQCPSCSSSLDCYPLFPHCDYSLSRCQECLSDSDCETRFGPLFSACSAGRCVQCRTDSDCPEHKCEHGWCGHCDGDWECQDGLVCDDDHCVPPLL